jgi:hypothetical protein
MSSEMRDVRDLINEKIIRKDLVVDPSVWLSVCDAMDAIDRAADLPSKISAADTLRAHFGLAALQPAAGPADLAAALVELKKHLQQKLIDAHRSFARTPVPESGRRTGLTYALSKLAEATEGEARTAWSEAHLPMCQDYVRDVRDALNARGYDGTETTAQAAYVLERTHSFFEGDLDQPQPGDLDIMTSVALPKLVADLDEIAHQVNVEDRSF